MTRDEIDGVYAVAIEQSGNRNEDMLTEWPSVAEG